MGGVVRFLDVEVDPALFEVRRAGSIVPTEPQVFEVLVYLIEHRDRVVPKEELLDNIWGDRFVSESALTSRIKSARRAVGDDGTRQHVIATVHGRGYRFVREIEHAPAPVDDTSTVDTNGSAPRRALTIAPPLLAARGDALAHLATAWSHARSGSGQLVVVRGEAGIGKSALVQTFLDRIDGTVAVATCLALRAPRPLAPISELVDQLERDAANARDHTAETAAARIIELVHGRPTVVAIDDLHFADDSTLDVVVLLARSLRDTPLLLIVTARAHEVPDHHPLWGVVADLRAAGADFIDLTPLGADGLAQLAAGTDMTVDELESRTGGIPLLVRELLSSPAGHLPDGVRDVVLARLARLPVEARRATELLAMSPVPLEVSVATRVAGDDAAALAHAERVGLVTTTADTIGFRHELVRDAVHDSVPTMKRLSLHRRLLDALPPGTDDARILHHAVEGLVTEVLATVGPKAARDAARRGSHREARTLLGKILRHCHDIEPSELAALTSEYAYQRYLMWELDDADEAAASAARLWHDLGEVRQEGSALTTLARVRAWTDPASAVEVGNRAVTLLASAGPSRELARAYCELAGLHAREMDFDAVTVAAEAGLEIAIDIADRGLHALALNYLGCASTATGRDDWEMLLRRSLDLAVGATPREYAVRACVNLSVALWDAGRWQDSADVVGEGTRLAAGVEYQTGVIAIRLQSAHVAIAADRLDDVEPTLDWITATDRSGSYEFEVELLRRLVRMRRNDASARLELRAMWAQRDGDDSVARDGVAPVEQGAWEQASDGPRSGPRTVSKYPRLLLMAMIAELAWIENDRQLAEEVAAVSRTHPDRSHFRTDDAAMCMYLAFSGVPTTVDDVLEPFASAIRGDLRAAADAFDRAGRPRDARACRRVADTTGFPATA